MRKPSEMIEEEVTKLWVQGIDDVDANNVRLELIIIILDEMAEEIRSLKSTVNSTGGEI